MCNGTLRRTDMSIRALQVLTGVLCLAGLGQMAWAQAFRVQCPATTSLHPAGAPTGQPFMGYVDIKDPATGLTYRSNGGQIKCQQVSGGDGYATMGDGTQTYLFAFGPLSGLADISNGLPGTETANVFNTPAPGSLLVGDPATTVSGGGAFNYNGAVGLAPDPAANGAIDGHVDPRPIMDVGVMNGNMPAPLMAIDEDDEFFLTLSNVGMIMRPDLFEQHTVHFHGYPNASAFYDGVPDASVAINIGGSFTYYYLAPDAGTYFWHCHITPPEHLQMGMVGQIYVRPRQNRVPSGHSLYVGLNNGAGPGAIGTATGPGQAGDLRTKCDSHTDILCSNNPPAINNGVLRAATGYYAYNDG